MAKELRSRWQDQDRLFSEAVQLAGSDRAAFLDAACADQPELRAAVERMLWADDEAGSFLDAPVAWRLRDRLPRPDEGEVEAREVGRQLGAYRLVELLATGGMGAIFRAERTDDAFERAVAIKMVRHRIARPDDVQRFCTEREVLARLDHPNIARLLDGGTTDDDRPFLVMELVDGLPIDRYCAESSLSARHRVGLFQQVCAAIEYAHQNLLIHRDIKPDNILVTGAGTVKVLDFGIAKLLEPKALPIAVPVTRTGARPMTPGYASPEQIRGQPATTRSEVFVLGALLFELLAGRSPFRLDGALPHEIESAICSLDGLPPLPGKTEQIDDDSRDSIRALRGDLGKIVGMALRADPERRYGSVAQLSDDLTRWTEHRPVRARPDRVSYRLRTFVRRNRALVTLAVVALTSLATLGLALRFQARDAAIERDRAENALRFIAGIFEVPDRNLRGSHPVNLREILDRGASRIERELGDHPEMRAKLFAAIGRMYISLGWFDQARHRLQQSIAIRRELDGGSEELATALYLLGAAQHSLGEYEEARRRLEESVQLRRRHFGTEHPAVAEALSRRAQADAALGRYELAEPSIREALRVRRTLLGEDHLDVAESLSHLGDLLYLSERDNTAVLYAYRSALAIRESLLGPDHLLVADSLSGVAVALKRAGRGREALATIRRAVGIERQLLSGDHPQLARTLFRQGEIARESGHSVLAEAALTEAITIARARLGALHPQTAQAQLSLGSLMLLEGRLDEADEELRQVERTYRAVLPPHHRQVAAAAFTRGGLLRRQGDFDAAREQLELSWRIVDGYAGPDARVRAAVLLAFGRLEADRRDPKAALSYLQDARDIVHRRIPPGHEPAWFVGEVEAEVGRCQILLGDQEEGRATILRGLAWLTRDRRVDDPRVIRARAYLGETPASAADPRAP